MVASEFSAKKLSKKGTPEEVETREKKAEILRITNENFEKVYERQLIRTDKAYLNNPLSFDHMMLTRYTDNDHCP